MTDPTQRFSQRASAYSRYRPSYPQAVLELLQAECGLTPQSAIADIGCGTGLLAELFLGFGCEVTGVEPNLEMRQAGEQQLARYTRFRSVNGRAEETGLASSSFDFVTAGQAFHWFDVERSGAEFRRISRPGGWLVLVWNERPKQAAGFQAEYAAAVDRHAPDLNRIEKGNIDLVFGGHNWQFRKLQNQQQLDRAGLVGRLSSASYAPEPGTPEHDAMEASLNELFDRHQQSGSVTLLYETLVYLGKLSG
jgi:SAM-dependent methyltransferase